MKILVIGGIVVATAATAVFPLGNNLSAKPSASVEAEINQEGAKNPVPSDERAEIFLSTIYPPCLKKELDADTPETQQPVSGSAFSTQEKNQTALQNDFSLKGEQQKKFYEHEDDFSVRDYSPDNLSLHPYAALPAERKPAEIVLDSQKGSQSERHLKRSNEHLMFSAWILTL